MRRYPAASAPRACGGCRTAACWSRCSPVAPRFAVEQGHGVARDLERCEDGGVLEGADAATVSDRAIERGLGQIGSLGSGNHFLEVQAVDRVYDAAAAAQMGLAEGTVCVMIHTGSRGLGHQICTDHVRQMEKAMDRYSIQVPDRQLACVPVRSPEGQAYLAAMAAAANYGRANRQLLTEATRRVFEAANRDDRWTCSTTCRTTWPSSKCIQSTVGTHRVCAPQRRDPLTATAPSRRARRAGRRRPAGADPGHDGHRLLRVGRSPRQPRVLLHRARCRASAKPPPGRPPHQRRRATQGSRRAPASSSVAAHGAGSPRKSPRPTRTSTRSSRPVTKPGWRARWPALSRWEW